jgi:hypothetical protein
MCPSEGVNALLRRCRLTAQEADAQAFLLYCFIFYCFIFGQRLLFPDRGPRKRAQLVARSAEKLL